MRSITKGVNESLVALGLLDLVRSILEHGFITLSHGLLMFLNLGFLGSLKTKNFKPSSFASLDDILGSLLQQMKSATFGLLKKKFLSICKT